MGFCPVFGSRTKRSMSAFRNGHVMGCSRCCKNNSKTCSRNCTGFTFLVLLSATGLQTLYIVLLHLDSFGIEYGTVVGIRRAFTNGLLHCDNLQGNVQFKEDFLKRIQDVYTAIYHVERWNNRTKSGLLIKIKRLISVLNAESLPLLKEPALERSKSAPISCTETFRGTLYDYPEYLKTWEYTNCTDNADISKLVTFVIALSHSQHEFSIQKSKSLLKKILDRHPSISIVVLTDHLALSKLLKMAFGRHVNVLQTRDANFHISLNIALTALNTPYVFVVRNLEGLDPYSNLRRPLTMLHNYPAIGAVLFGHRRSDGFWSADCYQSHLKNYELTIEQGYHQSFNESLVCHYGHGSFVSRTSLLRSTPLDKSLNSDGIAFLDFFLRLKADNYLVVNVPDYMVLTPVYNELKQNRRDWFPFVKKWVLNTLNVEGVRADFDCIESGIICRSRGYTNFGFMVPLCCLRAKSRMLNDVLQYTKRLNILAELDSGSVMSAVKFGRQINWDLDEDVCILQKDKDLFTNHTSELAKQGPYIVKVDPSGFTVVYEEKALRKLKIDLFTMGKHITIGNVHTGKYDPTRINYHGFDANVPYNPALYLRNRYGPEYLKHAPSWVSVGLKNSFGHTVAGKFIPCALPGHHACLDQYEADGNLDFGGL